MEKFKVSSEPVTEGLDKHKPEFYDRGKSHVKILSCYVQNFGRSSNLKSGRLGTRRIKKPDKEQDPAQACAE